MFPICMGLAARLSLTKIFSIRSLALDRVLTYHLQSRFNQVAMLSLPALYRNQNFYSLCLRNHCMIFNILVEGPCIIEHQIL